MLRLWQEMHPGYAEYAVRTPQLLPAVPVLSPALGGALRALAGWAAGAAEVAAEGERRADE